MNNSAGYLTKLVNELLDYIRIEKMGFALKCEDVNIVEKLRSTMFNFSDTIRNNNLRLEFTSGLDNAIVSADIAALDKILNNLILNAVKYAESLIEIHIDSKDNEMVIIRFENDGAGIPTEYRDEVFKPFVQYHKNHNTHKSGVGIGLPLAKNLAKMHLGDLVLDDGEQTCFILTLPLKSTEALNREIPENSIQETSTDRETVLIADDNREFREYLASKLGGSYRTICVSDGKSAYEVMKEENIDIMISDISMPEINGLELCQTVRKDIELSHIPIIIISARVSIESKIQAMEAGADLYIEKPFDLEYMRSSVKNILDKRSLMKSAFGSGLVKTDINMFGLPKKDEEFFTKFDSIIRENLGNNDFSNEALARLLNMSESTMLRKIKKLLNTSPNNYIKTVRLSVAADMLKDSHGNNISEICYTVGFSSVSYFAKCFREQYGMSPSEWCSRG
jgi:CheY-like chemotaxis protein